MLIRKCLKNWLHDASNKVWHKTSTARHSKEVIKNLSSKRTNTLLDLNRSEIQRIFAFSTGHGKFNEHLKIMIVITDVKCKYCEEEETARHIMCDCNAYSALKDTTSWKSLNVS